MPIRAVDNVKFKTRTRDPLFTFDTQGNRVRCLRPILNSGAGPTSKGNNDFCHMNLLVSADSELQKDRIFYSSHVCS